MTDFNNAVVKAISKDNNGIKLWRPGKDAKWFDISDNALQYVSKGDVIESATQQDGVITYVKTKNDDGKGNDKDEDKSGLASKQTGTAQGRYHPATVGGFAKLANEMLLSSEADFDNSEEWSLAVADATENLLEEFEQRELITKE